MEKHKKKCKVIICCDTNFEDHLVFKSISFDWFQIVESMMNIRVAEKNAIMSDEWFISKKTHARSKVYAHHSCSSFFHF